jgi:pyridoxine 5-phosphate synthase
MKTVKLRLGVNIDHVATVRNARGGEHPDPVRAALAAQAAGADGITAHLREDRRHIRDADMFALKEQLSLPLNFEMAATEEMQAIARKVQPHAVCLVPEKREEVTTEGGLNVVAQKQGLTRYIAPLKDAGMRVSLFIDAQREQVKAAAEAGADVVELHTGAYSELAADKRAQELQRIKDAASLASSLGLEVHAGHGLNYENVSAIAAIAEVVELNIGHFLMGEAMFVGMEKAIHTMRKYMDDAR